MAPGSGDHRELSAQLTALFPWAALVLPSRLHQAQSGGTGQTVEAASWRTESECEAGGEVPGTRACLKNERLPQPTLHTVLHPASFSPQLCGHDYR